MNALEHLEPALESQVRQIALMSHELFGDHLTLGRITGLYNDNLETRLNRSQAKTLYEKLCQLRHHPDSDTWRAAPERALDHFTHWTNKPSRLITTPQPTPAAPTAPEPQPAVPKKHNTAVRQPRGQATDRSSSMSVKNQGDAIAEYGAKVFDSGQRATCPNCLGDGEVDVEPDEHDIRRLVLGRENLAGSGFAKVAKLLENPDLATLRRIAEEADCGLDKAAVITEDLRDLYLEAG